MKPEQFIREYGAEKAREEFEKKLKCQDLLSELTFCEKTSSYEGDILPTNLATINGAYWAWVKRQAEMDEQQAKVEELQKQFDQHDKLLLQRNKDVQELYDINAKHVAEKAELQKRVDEQGLIIAKVMSIASDLQQSWAMFEIGKKLEQALKGEV
ncbi:hypothetical protein PJT24_003655 [Acinetobacter baumannii]|uniref:hypothetical protein n=1 Tax=Acinetobacter baumannii TaxID=470 RepID=UPI00210150BB|nr:hypothetical protein [Acinetobacter baumannii]